MATILSDTEVDDIRDAVGPEAGDEDVVTVAVWRRAAASGSVAGGAGLSRLGVPVSTGSNPSRPDQGFESVDSYPARFCAKAGKEFLVEHRGVTVTPYQFEFNWADEPDIRGDDELRVGDRRFLVKSPGGEDQYLITRDVLAVEVT